MNQVIEMFRESNERMRKVMKGLETGKLKPDMDLLAAAERTFENQVKLMNCIVNAYAIDSKNKRTMKALKGMNLLDEETAVTVGIGPPEEDRFVCEVNKKIMSRAQCLTHSGNAENIENCKGCDMYSINRNRVLGPKPYVA